MNFDQRNLFAGFAAGAAERWKYWLVVCALMTATAASVIGFYPRGVRAEQAAPGLRGAAAIEQLKQTGQYESLQAAFNQVRSNISLQQGITAGDGAQFDLFGYAVAMSGNTAIIGALGASGAQGDQGAAYV
ncbi:MAG TPA: FG-GAP repeat protein, partial [Blastocatellia bacterium]|nr:FG-GAP repeat protein [Blastocatellia bacterium]